MRMRPLLAAFLLILFLAGASNGQERKWAVSVAGGAVHNFKTPLRIYQQDLETIKLSARYRTEPFKPPVYYDIRISTWQHTAGWELRFTHHKLILDNTPPEVQRFSITNGYNLLTLNRLWFTKGFILSAGGGIVITHPESTIRNQPYPENKGIFNKGYYLSGPALELAIARQVYFADKWFALGEGRFTATYVEVPVAKGEAHLTNVALHGLLGVGYRFGSEPGKVKH